MGDEGKRPAPRRVRIDHRQVRVLAHPLRARLLGALRVQGPSTATTLAGLLDTNTGATSYHLRQLADVGLVVEEPDRGTARQRWWRAAHDITSWENTDFDDDPDARAAVEWIQAEQVRQFVEHTERWSAVRDEWPPAWRDAFGMSDSFMTIPADRLKELQAELWRILERYRAEADPDEPGAEQVQIFLASLPLLLGGKR
ncbi:Helix-turn-helix domain-containing protein [Micromonospora phaseoli]|uniref:Helix-turn-helix domain-containing protein n=1 Tax=Micromonospora phaseoli TaxID=1144548 RepID=A0A1H6SXR9_9ACTN|nr:helix-turn-helix domain-containing protein [Micromonospora phaseoli]PZW04079.1 ArsR family transcriptional regulator [Micromonospora phaseoli]GIJ79666.1 transcriptional regulator [Micromonospora phaseoli]SEI70624.1 Helix-turn-helix domain-containing protein [Micromonospora phaseoli]